MVHIDLSTKLVSSWVSASWQPHRVISGCTKSVYITYDWEWGIAQLQSNELVIDIFWV